jgi:DNA-binding NtrC family response regulator
MVDAGTFREELLARLSLTTIALPALRERGDDVLLLARHFLGTIAHGAGRPIPRFTDQASAIMRDYWWPGNVGELQNLVHHLLRTTDSEIIDAPDFPVPMRHAAVGAAARGRTLAEVEAEHIRGVMADVAGNKTRAAEILGINRKTLREKLRQAAPPRPES